MVERRSYPRYQVLYQAVDNQNSLHIGFVTNISKEGLRLVSPFEKQRKENFSVRIEAPYSEFPPLDVKLKVRWRGNRSKRYEEMGCIIEEVADQDRLSYVISEASK